MIAPGRTLRAEAEKADEALDRIIQIRFLPEAVPQPSAFLPVEPARGFCQFKGSGCVTSGGFWHFYNQWTALAVNQPSGFLTHYAKGNKGPPTQNQNTQQCYKLQRPPAALAKDGRVRGVGGSNIHHIGVAQCFLTSLFRGERQTTDFLFGQCNHPLHCSVSDIPQPPQERHRSSFVYAGTRLTSIWRPCL